ncbi:hypothetical protein GSI_04105 [Ganoderma sinense ZZ0214-1]|uniref:Reverse transcriptase domain-containing protein n=1 Tax=Ganoderma sinense ZZ0214-1 TaxID=1077348 RepID=A0A2G8SI96_9APHY|nr:hypothetical protein GSI_04105 [Ganoderma sinense ZZ0214-1]
MAWTVLSVPSDTLRALFQQCIDEHTVPQSWLTAIIAAVKKPHKDAADPASYRPIGLESCFLKTLTLLIDRRLREWADATGRLPDSQSGFRKGHRTANNAFVPQALIEKARHTNRTLFVVFLDLTNTFPTVDQPTLWLKLLQWGASGPLIDWLRILYSRLRYVELCGITMDAVGTFAEAVGKQNFAPYFNDMMAQAFNGIELGSVHLRECSFLFFGVMSRVFEDDFAQFLPNVVPALLQSCKQLERGEEERLAMANPETAANFASGLTPSSAINVSDDAHVNIDDDDSGDLEKLLDVNSTICIETEIAADTIGIIFAATKAHFLPYVEQCTLDLIALLPHYYDGIRKSATDLLLEIVRSFYELSDPPEWQPGATLLGHIVPPLLEMYETEDNKKVVSSLCVALADSETIKLGPAILEDRVELVARIAVQVLEQKAMCQQDPDQDESEDAPEDSAEYDSILISSPGPNFAGSPYEKFAPLILKHYKKNRSLSDRSSAIRTLSEIIGAMKSSVTPYTQSLMDLFYHALSDDEPEVQCNAAFASVLLIEHSEVDLSAQYLLILSALRPIFHAAPDAPAAKLNARDNAVGAVARMIVKNTAAVPLDQVLPVCLDALPLRNDYLENRPIFRAVFHLFKTQPALLHPHLDRLLQGVCIGVASGSTFVL